MKIISSLFVLVIGIAANAQKPDSVTVIYDNQETQIPVPEFGKKTTIKMTDSIQSIEIVVSKSRTSDNLTQSNELIRKNPKKRTKWFSQVEAGFVIGFANEDAYPPISSIRVNTDPLPGFSLGLSVFDRERMINRSLSYNLGLKFGLMDNFNIKKPKPVISNDSVNYSNISYFGYDPYTITSFQLLIPLGMRYTFGKPNAISRISFGVNMGTSFNFLSYKVTAADWESRISFGMPLVAQTYLGYEYKKLGILGTMEFTSLHNLYPLSAIKYKLGLSLTYRFF